MKKIDGDPIVGDPVHPIYTFALAWIDQQGQPDRTSVCKMYAQEQSDAQLNSIGKELVQELAKVRDVREDLMSFEVSSPKYETWMLEWFCHATIDDGRSDQEFLRSFSRYVSRYAHMQDWPPSEDFVTLMGAEDYWRWSGEKGQGDPPCRCEICTEQGVVRINH